MTEILLFAYVISDSSKRQLDPQFNRSPVILHICILGTRISELWLVYCRYSGLDPYHYMHLLQPSSWHRVQRSHILPQFKLPLKCASRMHYGCRYGFIEQIFLKDRTFEYSKMLCIWKYYIKCGIFCTLDFTHRRMIKIRFKIHFCRN